jgi:two-component system, chemotaxis family, chemotaxis protein CheY
MKFLVIDDSVTMRRILVNTLERIGYADTVEACDGADALTKFDASIQFIVTDWNMPNMSGTDFTRAVRARPEGKDVPILMVTMRSVREDILEALHAGVDNYVLKPFTSAILKEKIEQMLPVERVGAQTR